MTMDASRGVDMAYWGYALVGVTQFGVLSGSVETVS